MQCQKTYLAEGHCKNETTGASKWCRWHKIIEEFRADLSRIPRIAAQGMMFTSSIMAYGVVYCLWMFAREGILIWPMLAIYLCGATAKYFADGCIAQDHPFAQFALWGKLLAFGLFVEITLGVTLGYYLPLHSSEGMAVVRQVTTEPFWTKYGPPLLTVTIIIETGYNAHILIRRVLFLRKPILNSFVMIMVFSMIGTALRPIWWTPAEKPARTEQPRQVAQPTYKIPDVKSIEQPNTPENYPTDSEIEKRRSDEFWQPAIGESYWKVLIGVCILGFILAEVINKRIRLRDKARPVFRATIWPSYPICYGSPFLGAACARFIMVWAKTQNPWLFGTIVIAITAVATAVGTKLVVSNYLAALRRYGIAPKNRKERREELLLYLSGVSNTDIVFEIELVLEYAAVGFVESYYRDDDFLIVKMVGASANSIFGALQDLLESTSIHTGSFLIMRYGNAGEERMIEL